MTAFIVKLDRIWKWAYQKVQWNTEIPNSFKRAWQAWALRERARVAPEPQAVITPAEQPPVAIRTKAKDRNKTDRRAAVDEYIEEVFTKTGERITRTDIWKSAGYKSRTEFERWERDDPIRPNAAAHEIFTRILIEKPHLK